MLMPPGTLMGLLTAPTGIWVITEATDGSRSLAGSQPRSPPWSAVGDWLNWAAAKPKGVGETLGLGGAGRVVDGDEDLADAELGLAELSLE